MHHEESNEKTQTPDEATTQSGDINRHRRRGNKSVLVVIACAALALLAYWYFFASKPTSDTTVSDAQLVVSVRTAKAERQPIAMEVRVLGTIFPREQATVSANIGAQIRQMRLLRNKVVRVGETIAVLASRDLQAQRAEAVAALENARLQARGVTNGTIPQGNAQVERDLRDARASVANSRTLYERRRDLYAKGGIALKDVEAAQLVLTTAADNLRLVEHTSTLRASAINPNDRALAQSNITQAEERVAALDAQLSYATVRAPLTGIVIAQFQFEGEYAAPGTRLVTIADTSEVIIKAQLADTVVANLNTGDAATVLPSDLPGERLRGRISLISRSSDPLNRTVEVWVNLDNTEGQLRAGGAAEIVVATRSANDALIVPLSAVMLDASNAENGTVMTIDADSITHETRVKVGIRTPEV
ncbi:MAG: efflux RND transporter periplasmic adaptor subunit, partial [Pyrinomonadaceae bacterium]